MKYRPASVSSWGRRDLLKVAAAAAGAIPASASVAAESADHRPSELVDSNVSLFRWPLRRLPCDETAALVAKLRGHGVTQAWAGSFDGLLHRDLASANARLAEECRRQGGGVLVPFGSVNPALPDWEDDLRRCAEEHRMPGIRLHPGYHGYGLDHPGLAKLLRMAAGRGLLVQLVSVMEDRRMMHPLLQVEPPGLRTTRRTREGDAGSSPGIAGIERTAIAGPLTGRRGMPGNLDDRRRRRRGATFSRKRPRTACCSAPTPRCFISNRPG